MSESLPLSSDHSNSTHEHQRFIDDEETPRRSEGSSKSSQVDVKNGRYPFCLVWGPLPVISWIFPWIGHMGVGDSEGKTHDFAGPYFIGIDNFMTPIFKYYQFPKELWQGKESAWDIGLLQSDAEFRKTMHNICCNNCHHHSARALSNMKLNAATYSESDMMSAWWLITTRGKYVSTGAWLCTFLPMMLGIGFMLFIIFLVKA